MIGNHTLTHYSLDQVPDEETLRHEIIGNQDIIEDRFHIVKLLNETINSIRIKVMNAIKTSRPSDYNKLKKQWKLL
ncbi:transposase, partial [Aerococcus urinaeequi]|uniref:transposase n=1 Tax=Aerococcus urinaeequi TaxID=51665 RepID=UPI003EC4B997